jgi:murein L,D-transpeptidase YcbB/YkuD
VPADFPTPLATNRSPRHFAARLATAALGLLWAAASLAGDVQNALREQVVALATGQQPAVLEGAPVVATDLIPTVYAARDFRPAWSDARRVEALRAALQTVELHGLEPADYRAAALDRAAEALRTGTAGTPQEQARLDVALTDSLAQLLTHLRHGKTDPLRFYADWKIAPEDEVPDLGAELSATLQSGDIQGAVSRAIPTYPAYQRLVKALKDYRALQAGAGWPTVSAGDTIRPGESSPRIREVRARLRASGEFHGNLKSEVYDAELADAVKRFQASHGLGADGALGKKTIAALNVSIGERVDQIRVNLERMRWALHALRGTYVVVDIAGYDVTFVRDDKVAWKARAQVGQPLRKTPVLRSHFTDIVLNPNWTVPPTVIDQDIIPAARKDPEIVNKKGLRIYDKERNELDPYAVDWSLYNGKNFPYRLRQDPGEANSLGRIKFNFPNRHAVYMHDTPKKAYFERTERAFSSGCIRVEKPLELAELLLDDPQRWTQAQVEGVIGQGKTRTLLLKKPIPVLVLYATVDVDEQGRVRFKPDIYDKDRLVLDELRKPSRSYGTIRAARTGRESAVEATSETTSDKQEQKEAHGV